MNEPQAYSTGQAVLNEPRLEEKKGAIDFSLKELAEQVRGTRGLTLAIISSLDASFVPEEGKKETN